MTSSTVQAICIGDELLDGTVRDRNFAYLGEFASESGLRLQNAIFVADEMDAIVDALASSTAQTVVVSGGLGPTRDDITRDAAAQWQGVELVEDSPSLKLLQKRFEEKGHRLTDNNRRQASFPANGEILSNGVGSAPGFKIRSEGQTTFFFPGVPKEFQWFCRTHLELDPEPQFRSRLYFHGLGESALETTLKGIQSFTERGVRIGYRAQDPMVELKLTSHDQATLEDARSFALSAVGAWNIGENDEGLAERVGRLLNTEGATVSTAESCTAGGIAAAITDVAGSSGWFERGFVTYSNQAKSEMIGVGQDVLDKFGAVSPQTVLQMAAGAREAANATYALSVSGIAGPGGGSADKPVGTVHFGLATPEGVYHRLVVFRRKERDKIRAGTVYSALSLLLWRLENNLSAHSVLGPFSQSQVQNAIQLDPSEFVRP